MGFNPDQPRDEKGQWTSGGGPAITRRMPKGAREFLRTQRARLNVKPPSVMGQGPSLSGMDKWMKNQARIHGLGAATKFREPSGGEVRRVLRGMAPKK